MTLSFAVYNETASFDGKMPDEVIRMRSIRIIKTKYRRKSTIDLFWSKDVIDEWKLSTLVYNLKSMKNVKYDDWKGFNVKVSIERSANAAHS